MIELTVLKHLVESKDEIALTQLDDFLFLDTYAKKYFKLLKHHKETYDTFLSEKDLEVLTKTENIFENVTSISHQLLPLYIDQLKDRYNKFTFFEQLSEVIDRDSDFEELIDSVQDILLSTDKNKDSIQAIDCANINIEQEDFILRKPLGFGKFDEVNGGLGISELGLIGGWRGSGKSLLALHTALTRYKLGSTVAFISIEMRYSEVGFRLDAMISGLPIQKIQNGKLSFEEYQQLYLKKANFFCKNVDESVILKAKSKIELANIYKNLERKDHKFFLYDLPTCTPTDINFIVRKLKKLNNLEFCVVDYLNIIKVPHVTDTLDWKAQVLRSENLKSIARENDIAMLTLMQVDEEGKVKFAKAIEDSVDLSLIFKKAKVTDGGVTKLVLRTSKIRNGFETDFNLYLNKNNLQISSSIGESSEKPRNNTDKPRN